MNLGTRKREKFEIKRQKEERKRRLKLKGQIIYKRSKNKSKEDVSGGKHWHIAGL
jgi:hypothetical protein